MSVKPLNLKTHLIFWAGVFVSSLVFVWVFKAVLLPFVLGIAVAYLLNPIVNKLGQMGIARAPAAMMILGSFLILILGFIGAISPIIYREFIGFSDDLPGYIEKITALLAPVTAMLDEYIGGAEGQNVEDILKEHSGTAIKTARQIVTHLAAGGQAVVDMVSVAVFMPIVAYFMMKEWPLVIAWAQGLMPRHSKDTIMDLFKEIDKKISGFVRGQITVAVFLGVGYAIALTIAGLKYGFMIGLMSGLLSVIPMVGSAVGLIVSVAVAWFQSGDIMFMALIAGIFIGGQVIEGNFLTPKLVGDSVGLHPLWVFFALLAGGSVLGILGMFLAVPVAAVIGVLLSFLIYKYKQSAYYLDSEVEEPPAKKGVASSKKATVKKTVKRVAAKTKSKTSKKNEAE
ncbi:MAG: AI-2E family transporter [Alphaproteobacteria bacterium]